MNLQYILIKNKLELSQYEEVVLGLFRKCFGKELDKNLWQWAYLKNPIGDPIVSLCFNKNKELIGHYAVIPYLLEQGGEVIMVALSMTTMVDAKYRRHGIIIKQATIVYESASKENYKMIIAFPNKNSAPVFKVLLGWKLDALDYISEVSKEEISNDLDLRAHLLNQDIYEFARSNSDFIYWRLSKPNCTYHQKSSVILKEFDKNEDIVFLSNKFEKDLEDGRKYNVLVDGKWKGLIKKDSTEYQFGYKLFDKSLEPFQIKKDLILSDVF
jgi:hypothetical protein